MREAIDLLTALERKLHSATAVCEEEDAREAQLRQQIDYLGAQLARQHGEIDGAFSARKIRLDARLRVLASESERLKDEEEALKATAEQLDHDMVKETQLLESFREEFSSLLTATAHEIERLSSNQSNNAVLHADAILTIRRDIDELESNIGVATKNLEALTKLTQRHTATLDDLKEKVWESKSNVFAKIKENESLEKELCAVAAEKQAALAAAHHERYLRLAERQQAASKSASKSRVRKRDATKASRQIVVSGQRPRQAAPPKKKLQTLREARNELVQASTLLESTQKVVSLSQDSSIDSSSVEFSLSDSL